MGEKNKIKPETLINAVAEVKRLCVLNSKSEIINGLVLWFGCWSMWSVLPRLSTCRWFLTDLLTCLSPNLKKESLIDNST